MVSYIFAKVNVVVVFRRGGGVGGRIDRYKALLWYIIMCAK